eukprot:s857_g23.t1
MDFDCESREGEASTEAIDDCQVPLQRLGSQQDRIALVLRLESLEKFSHQELRREYQEAAALPPQARDGIHQPQPRSGFWSVGMTIHHGRSWAQDQHE